MSLDITAEQLDSLIQEIKSEYAVLAKSEEMAKAEMPAAFEEKKEGSKSEKKEESSKEGSKPEASKTEGSKSEMKKDDAVATEPAPEAPDEAPAPDAAPEDAGDVGADQLFDMYSKLDEEQLAMHYMACSKALYSKMDQPDEEAMPEAPVAEEPAAPEAVAPPAAPEAAPAPEASKPSPFGKAEVEELEKLRKENADLKGKTSDLEKKVDEVADTLQKVVSHPSRKAFSGSNFSSNTKPVVVTEEKVLSKSEIMSALNEKARDPKLSEADRSKIYSYSIKPVFNEELKKFLSTSEAK